MSNSSIIPSKSASDKELVGTTSGQPSVSKYPLYLSARLGHKSTESAIKSSSESMKEGVPEVEKPMTSGQPSVSANPL